MSDKPHYVEHRQRLRERFLMAGASGLQEYELLELLLTYAVPRLDVKPVAKELLRRFGGLAGVLDASQKELESAYGFGPASAILVRLVKNLCAAYLEQQMKTADVLSTPEAVTRFAKMKLAGLKHEAFMVVYVNVKNMVIGHEIVNEGTVDHAVVYPRRIIESALATHAAGLILVHNHPSGDPEPSPEDRKLTRNIVDAARTMDIRVLDHVVVGRAGHYSFHENNLLPRAK